MNLLSVILGVFFVSAVPILVLVDSISFHFINYYLSNFITLVVAAIIFGYLISKKYFSEDLKKILLILISITVIIFCALLCFTLIAAKNIPQSSFLYPILYTIILSFILSQRKTETQSFDDDVISNEFNQSQASKTPYYKIILKSILTFVVLPIKLPYKISAIIQSFVFNQSWNIVAILVVILLYLFVRLPYISTSLTGYHDLKYSSYVEPATHMVENGPLWLQKKYMALPSVIPDGKSSTFSEYPFIEWGLATTLTALPENTIEENVHIYTSFIGTIITILLYALFVKFTTKVNALIIMSIIVVNPIYQFFTFVTVNDSTLIVLTLISSLLLIHGIERSSPKTIYLAGITAGICINVKYSAALFLLPLQFVMVFLLRKRSLSYILTDTLFILPQAIIQTVLFRLTVRKLPIDPIKYSLITAFIWFLEIHVYYLAPRIYNYINKLLSVRWRQVATMVVGSIVGIVGIIALSQISWISALAGDFLTDKGLIFNVSLYQELLGRITDWASPVVVYTFLISLLIIPFYMPRRTRILLYGFLFSAFTYFISTTKVLYFHEYYFHIIMITIGIGSGLLIGFLRELLPKVIREVLVIALLVVVFISNQFYLKEFLGKERLDIMPVSSYLSRHLESDEFFMMNNIPVSINFYSHQKSFEEQYLSWTDGSYLPMRESMKKDIDSGMNIGQLMKKNKVKYYVIRRFTGFNKVGFVSLLDDEIFKQSASSSFRTQLIRCEVNNDCAVSKLNSEKLNTLFREKVQTFMKLEYETQGYQIFRFTE